MKKNFLIVSCVYPPEPLVSARLSFDIFKCLKSNGNNVKVLHPVASRPEGYIFNDDLKEKEEVIVDSYVCPKSSLFGRFRESLSFGLVAYRYIEKHSREIDVIYSNTWPLFGQYYVVKAANKHNIPCFTHVQDIYPDSYCKKLPKFLGRILFCCLLPIDKYILKKSKGVFAISEYMMEYLAFTRKVCKSSFTLVRNWQDDAIFRVAYKPIEKSSERINIMYLGNINPTANVPLIIRAFSRLEKSKFCLSIVGSGPSKDECLKLAMKLDLDVNFETVEPEAVAQKQSQADILVLCLKEGVAKTATPSKLTAYMLSGRPIIASVDVDSDCAKIISDAGCGVVVEPDNVDVLTNAIEQIGKLNSFELNRLGKLSYDYALKELSKESNLKILIETIMN